PEQLRDAEALELGEMVAERTGLRRAAAGARDVVPTVRRRLPGYAGARIDIDDGAAREPGQIHGGAIGGNERHGRELATREMSRRAVVLRRRDAFRQHGRIMRGGTSHWLRPPRRDLAGGTVARTQPIRQWHRAACPD